MRSGPTDGVISTLLRHDAASIPCLSVVGKIDGRTVELFAGAVRELIDRSVGRARLDLSAVTAFGTPGLAALCTLGELAAQHDVVLMIHTSAVIREKLRAAGLTSEP